MKRKGLFWVAAGFVGLYVYWSETRISNLLSVTNLAYDAASCCEVGEAKAKVTDCFKSRGYLPRKFAGDSDLVPVDLALGTLSLRRYDVRVTYDKAGSVIRWTLGSSIAAL
jgi:hypothetical protein